MNYKQLNQLLAGKTSKSVGFRTHVRKDEDGVIQIWFYSTPIISYYPNGRIELNPGDWKTYTTKRKMNNFLPGSFRVVQKTWEWFLETPKGIVDFPSPDEDIHSIHPARMSPPGAVPTVSSLPY